MCCFKHHWCQDHFYDKACHFCQRVRLLAFASSDLLRIYSMASFITSLIIAKCICIYLISAQDSCEGDRYNTESGRSYPSHFC